MLDIMVVWTSHAECMNAGLQRDCRLTHWTEDAMRGLIDLAVAETNTAFDLSGIDTELRLVHAYRESEYEEVWTKHKDVFDRAIQNMKLPDDGELDDIHEKRRLYGADLVALIVGDTQYCGQAVVRAKKTNVFSVTSYQCATGYYSFAHEIAHNMGALHDKAFSDECSSSNYNHGWRDPNSQFRSILSYDCKKIQCDNLPRDSCPRVQMFSTPDHLYKGKAIGSKTVNNARQISDATSKIAAFFPAWDCTKDSDCFDRPTRTSGKCIRESRSCDFTPPEVLPVGQTGFMETVVVQGGDRFSRVHLKETYVSPIPVCTIQYTDADGDTVDLEPATVRISHVESTSFVMRLQNPSETRIETLRDVHCVVVEEGSWTMPGGRKIEARAFRSRITDHKGSWQGEQQTFVNTYTNPVVLGQVTTLHDWNWSTFWSRGSTRVSPTSFFAGKHVGGDDNTSRSDETVGYIVIESGHSDSKGVEVEAAVGPATVVGVLPGESNYRFQSSFSVSPKVAIASQASMRGSDGSWAVLGQTIKKSGMQVAVDEDEITSDRRHHTGERLGYLVMSDTASLKLRYTSAVWETMKESK